MRKMRTTYELLLAARDFKSYRTNRTDIEKYILVMVKSVWKYHETPEPMKVELTQAGMDLLKKVSKWLRFSDRQKLKQKYVWGQQVNLTQALRQDQSLLLACIYYKEIVQIQCELDVVQFVAACLTTIEREDLRKKFVDLVAKQQQLPLRKVPQQRSKSVPRPQQPTTSNKDVDLPKLVDQVAGIEKKVSEIHETIQSTKKDFNKGFDSTKSNINFLDPMSMYAPPPYAQRDTFPSF